jgi:hypothetical protein
MIPYNESVVERADQVGQLAFAKDVLILSSLKQLAEIRDVDPVEQLASVMAGLSTRSELSHRVDDRVGRLAFWKDDPNSIFVWPQLDTTAVSFAHIGRSLQNLRVGSLFPKCWSTLCFVFYRGFNSR